MTQADDATAARRYARRETLVEQRLGDEEAEGLRREPWQAGRGEPDGGERRIATPPMPDSSLGDVQSGDTA